MTTAVFSEIGTTETTIYTCPAAKTATVSRVSVANILESDITFHISYYNATDNATVYFIKNGHLSSGQNHISISNSNTLSMSADDYITILSDTEASIDAIITYEEVDV